MPATITARGDVAGGARVRMARHVRVAVIAANQIVITAGHQHLKLWVQFHCALEWLLRRCAGFGRALAGGASRRIFCWTTVPPDRHPIATKSCRRWVAAPKWSLV